MMPDDALSSLPVTAAFVETVNRRSLPLVDFEMGGADLQDPSGGLQVQLWTAEYKDGGVYIRSDTHPESLLFTRAGVTLISVAFDQNMRPAIAFTDGSGSYLWWYDATVPGTVFMPITGTNLRITIDEKRQALLSYSDIILAYNRAGNLYYRQQRERFLTERLLASSVDADLITVGMNTTGRLQFRLRPH